jgi:hypothetical protein
MNLCKRLVAALHSMAFAVFALSGCDSSVGPLKPDESAREVRSALVESAADLVAAVNSGADNAIIEVGPGTFELTAPLRPKPGMIIRGAGKGVTIIRNAASWAPGNAGLELDEGAYLPGLTCDSYLFSLAERTTNLRLSEMTLTAPQLHGAICGVLPHGLELDNLEFKGFLWSAVRTFIMEGARIHDNVFENAGGRSGGTTGSTGGALFLTYSQSTEIWNNRFSRSPGFAGEFYGVKGREARDMRIHHNTIDTDFAIELPFEIDWRVEIDHNYLGGTVSIPRYAGGEFPAGSYSFHVHHNYFKTSYAFEYQRNGIEIDHNLFDFSTDADYGNLIASFDAVPAVGGTTMHDNLISNPGRGIYWNEGVYNNFAFYNNHVRGNTTVTPRTEGLFDFRSDRNGGVVNWSSIQIRDNIFEFNGIARPLMRNPDSYAAVIENNTLSNISDVASYANAAQPRPRGPLEPLNFTLGAYDSLTVNQWVLSSTPSGDAKCADENGRCEFTGTRQVRYGASGSFVTQTFSDGVDCNNTVFGDPIVGVFKACYVVGGASVPPAPVKCADENGRCEFTGTRQVRYGANDSYVRQTFTGGVDCNNSVFGDPLVGVGKACYLE